MYLNILILLFLTDKFREKGFIFENFSLKVPSPSPTQTQTKTDSCTGNHLIFHIEDIQDNFIRWGKTLE